MACPSNFQRRNLNLLRKGDDVNGIPSRIDTGLNFLGEHSLKTCQADTQVASATAAGTIVAAVPQAYHIIRGFILGAQQLAAGTSTGTSITCTKYPEGTSQVIGAVVLAPLQLSAANQGLDSLGIICAPNTAITLADLTAAPTSEIAIVYYDTVQMVE